MHFEFWKVGPMSAGVVQVVEVGPRDGLQNERVMLSTAQKVELIRRSVHAGLRRVEVTSFVHPRLVPQLADAEAVMAAVRAEGFETEPRWIGLVLNARGLARAVDAGVDEVNLAVVASETFSRRNQNAGIEQMLDTMDEIVAGARAAGIGASVVIAAAFGCPFEGEVPAERVLGIAARCLAAGVDELAVADTIGVGVPAQVRTLVAGIRELSPTVPQRAHFHNTRNTGYANALAAVEAGVRSLDASTGGIGGCPFAPAATGNIATEDLLYLLHRSGYRTGPDQDVDQAAVARTGSWIAGQLDIPVPALLGRAGGFPATGPAPTGSAER
jgi:hydroxymethylglutaryl-CoA lyase